jgi:hypothetical protein
MRSESGKNSPSAAASRVIVRNLTSLKGRPCRPGRLCMKKTGRPMKTTTQAAMANINGLRMIKPALDIKMSKNRLAT